MAFQRRGQTRVGRIVTKGGLVRGGESDMGHNNRFRVGGIYQNRHVRPQLATCRYRLVLRG